MRLKAVNIRLALSSLLAVLALGAVAASAAQAATAEGPFYKITGTRLLEKSTQEVTGKSYNRFEFSVTSLGIVMGCGKAKLASGAKLLGSTGANFSSYEATIEFSECSLTEGNGAQEGCQIKESKFKTEPLKLELGYLDGTRSGDISVLLTPVVTKGDKFGHILFTGGLLECQYEEMPIVGDTIALIGKSNGAPIEVGREPAAAKTSQIFWPAKKLEETWLEEKGSLVEYETGLISEGHALVFTGGLELELTTGATWGIFT